MRVLYVGYELWEDPLVGWLWHKLDNQDRPTPGGEWGLAPSMDEAMEQIEGQLDEDEIRRWSLSVEEKCPVEMIESVGDDS